MDSSHLFDLVFGFRHPQYHIKTGSCVFAFFMCGKLVCEASYKVSIGREFDFDQYSSFISATDFKSTGPLPAFGSLLRSMLLASR